MGRTGKWWSHQLLGDVQPDMMLFAKGIASGFPFAGIASRPELYDKMVPGMMVKAPAAPAAWQGALPGLPALPCDAQPPPLTRQPCARLEHHHQPPRPERCTLT
jgi:hypothetical protein